MITAKDLTMKYGDKTVVDRLNFDLRPGVVTGFLGPNGAGKSTTMRMIIGLDRPTGGSVTVHGKSYRDLPAPLQEVGVLLEARAVHTGRSAYHHLLAMAVTHGISKKRVQEVIDLAGLTEVARQRVGAFSLGMGQRLGIAAALLGDPQTLILDEPVNGLDPDGVLWVRNLLRGLAAEGRTVFVSSHLMSEMAQTAEHLIVIGKGRLLADQPIADIIHSAGRSSVLVRTPEAERLRDLLVGATVTVTSSRAGELEVDGSTAEKIGEIAFDNRIMIHQLTSVQASLEEAFMELTNDAVEYHGGTITAKDAA
jgi:ABC-2 type transport system ATP-binding protein